MDDERLEWALRRLPGVLACSLDGDTVTLLLDPHASAIDVEAGANALLLNAGDPRPPLVLGGTRPFVPVGRRRFDVVPVVKAAGPGLVAVGAAALVATLVASPAAFWRDAPVPPAPQAATGLAIDAPAALGGRRAAKDGGPAAPAPAEVVAPARSLVLLVPELPDPSPAEEVTDVVQLAVAVDAEPAETVVSLATASVASVASVEAEAKAGEKHKAARAARPANPTHRDEREAAGERNRRSHGRAAASTPGPDRGERCDR